MSLPTADHLFTRLPEYQVIVCRKCQYAIRPTGIVEHLRRSNHQIPLSHARYLQETILSWDGYVHDPQQLNFPTSVQRPIQGLAVYTDGLLCTVTADCSYVCRSRESIRKHWRQDHHWSPASRGGVPQQDIPIIQQSTQEAMQRVICQRFFTTAAGSHYIHIRQPSGLYQPEDTPTPVHISTRLAQLLDQIQLDSQSDTYTVIQAGEIDEANPWLRRSQWAEYLQGINRRQLCDSISTPTEDTEGTEAVAHRIWVAMGEVAQISQQITQATGNAIRSEAARTEKDRSPVKPLQAYMDMASIRKHVEPWQRVLMFFVRTQVPHEWGSPRYQFTPRQSRAWTRLWYAAQQPTEASSPDPGYKVMDRDEPEDIWTPIQAACMQFCIELLNQRASVHEYECTLVCALAVLGCKPEGWHDTDSYPPILSRMIKIARFMVLHTAVRLDPNAGEIVMYLRGRGGRVDRFSHSPLDDEEYKFVEANHRPPSPHSLSPSPVPSSPSGIVHFSQPQRYGSRRSFADWVTRQVDSFMVRGTRGPMQWMLDLRMYGLKVHYNTTPPGNITWMGQDELLYKDISFTMGDFRGFTHGLVGATRQLLREQLLLAHDSIEVPAIPWDRMRDDPTQTKAGWSFLDDSRTRWPVDGSTWLTGRLGRADPRLRRFIRTSTSEFNMTAIDQYMNRVVEFREKLSVLIHVTSGQPARAPELLSLRHRNTEGAVRNVFIEDSLVVLASKYHKGFYASNDAKIIHRYLPRDVGALVVWYLWLVLPFVERLQRYQHQVRSQDHAASSESGDWGRTVRQWAYIWSPDPRTGREWTSERFREVLKRETAIGLHGAALTIPAYRNIAIGISRRFLRESSVFPQNQHDDGTTEMPVDDADDEGKMDPEQYIGHIADLQAAHSSHVAGMIYGREVTEQAGTTAHRREMFRLSSTDWHRFLGFPDVEDGLARLVGKRKCPFDEEAQAQNHQRRYQLSRLDMCDVMQKMTGMENITFRGNQAAVIQAIQRGSSPVVATMPTGGGKSMCFMLPAFAVSGLTVVVVPLLALRGDMMRRCQQVGISCVEWESRRPPDEARIVLVTPESALGAEFRQFLNRQIMFKRLDRIVIDECHVMLNQSSQYRPQLQQLGKLMGVGTQMVFLTATLPPSAEQTIWDLIKVPATDIHLYRSRTRRINVAYRVWRPSIDTRHHGPDQWIQMPSVVSFIQDRIRRSQGGRVIIYGHTISHVKLIAEVIGCEAYFKDQVDRAGVLERFRQTPSAVVVATSALGMGVDIPDIRSIIHIGRPRTLLEYAQESGRAGRDGDISEAVMIIPAEMDSVPGYAMDQTADDQARVDEYIAIKSPGCRRRVLDRYLDGAIDGYERDACGDSNEDLPMAEVLCDGCQPDWQGQEAVLDDVMHKEDIPDGSSSVRASIVSPSPSARSGSGSASDQGVSVVRRAGYADEMFGGSQYEPGIVAGMLPAAIQQRFHEQDIRRRQPMTTYRDKCGRELQDEEILTQDALQWRQRCWSCWRHGRADDHELFHCPMPGNQAAKQFKKAMDLGKIKFPAYAACWQCGMPQSICLGWQRNERGERHCEYRHCLIPMVASMLYGDGADESVRVQWRIRVQQAGFDSDDIGSMVRYFGGMAESNWVQHTELVATFIWLRRLYRGIEN